MTLNLTSQKAIFGLCRKYKVYPSKKLGQNFLIDESASKKFLKAADLGPKDIILEIGPGIGSLTQVLAKKVKKVIAVEKDPKMCEILKESLKDFNNVEIVHADILKVGVQNPKSKFLISKQIPNLKFQIPKNYKVVANLPFYLTVPVIRKFLELTEVRPRSMVFFIQKEVAQRICARPPKMNFLAILVQFYAKPEIISYISKKSFWPQPKVDSAIIKITPESFTEVRPKGPLAGGWREGCSLSILQRSDLCQLFFRIVRAGFSQPRKQISNNLSKVLKLDKDKVKVWLLKNGIQPKQRAEILTIENWVKLTKNFKTIGQNNLNVRK